MEPKINLLAVAAGAFAYFTLGAIWFAPGILGNKWRELSGLPPDHSDNKRKFLRGLALSALCCFLTTYVLAHFLQYAGGTTIPTALQGSAWICLGFVGLTQLQDFLFTRKTLTLFAINAGYQIAGILLAGAVLGAWPE